MEYSHTELRRPASQNALFSLALAYFILGAASLTVVGLSFSISETLPVTAAQTGLLISVFALTFAVAALILPLALGTWPLKRLLLTGLVLLTLGLLAGAAAPTFTLLLLTRAVVACGAAMVGPVASAIGTLLVPPARQTQALATVFAGFTVASVVGLPLASLLGPILGWRGVLLMLAALSVLVAALAWKFVPPVAPGQQITWRMYCGFLKQPGTFRALLTTLLQMASIFVVYGVTGAYLADRFGSTPAWISAALLGYGLAGMAGNASLSLLRGRWGLPGVLNLALLGSGLMLVALLALPPIPLLGVAAFTCWGLFTTMFPPLQQARLVQLHPSARTLMLAVNASILYLGMSLGAWLGSVLLPVLGGPALPWPALVLMSLALLTSQAARGSGRTDSPSGVGPD